MGEGTPASLPPPNHPVRRPPSRREIIKEIINYFPPGSPAGGNSLWKSLRFSVGGRCPPNLPFRRPPGWQQTHYKLIANSGCSGEGPAPPEPPLSAGLPGRRPTTRPEIIMKIIKVLCRGALPPEPPVAPASRPATNSLKTQAEIIKVGGGLRPPPNPPFAPAYRPVIGSIIINPLIIFHRPPRVFLGFKLISNVNYNV